MNIRKRDINPISIRELIYSVVDVMEILKVALVFSIVYVKNWFIDIYKVNEFMKKYSNDKRLIVKDLSQEYFVIDDSIVGYFSYKKVQYEYNVIVKDEKYKVNVIPIEWFE